MTPRAPRGSSGCSLSGRSRLGGATVERRRRERDHDLADAVQPCRLDHGHRRAERPCERRRRRVRPRDRRQVVRGRRASACRGATRTRRSRHRDGGSSANPPSDRASARFARLPWERSSTTSTASPSEMQPIDQMRADESGTTDDDDVHDRPIMAGRRRVGRHRSGDTIVSRGRGGAVGPPSCRAEPCSRHPRCRR